MLLNQASHVVHEQTPGAWTLRHYWGAFLAEGIILLALGLFAIVMPVIASIATTLVFGWIFLVAGGVGLVSTFRSRQAPGFAWSLLSALVGIAAGVLLLVWPLRGTVSLTVVLICFLLVEGVASVFYALEHRRGMSGRWGWMLGSGLLDLALGALLLAGLPGTAVWALGLVVGVNMIFGGWALIAMALHARSAPPVDGPGALRP
jgi:uncharacterized membrane protein HdeD (DUF308 family)